MPLSLENNLFKNFSRFGLTLFILIQVQPVLSQITNEAEFGVLSNGAYSDNCPTCSDGKDVRYIGGDKNGSVTFEHVSVPRAGLYPVTILYRVGDDRSFVITVNDNARFDLIFGRSAKHGAVVKPYSSPF